MSELLDELARSLATPMPRRRALRTLGAAIVGVWVGGAAPSAHARSSEHWCHAYVRKLGWKFCTAETDRCFPTCCPKERTCSIGPSPNGCPVLVSCCNPCNPLGSRPLPGGECGPGPVASYCPCKPGQKPCRTSAVRGAAVECCEQDEYCAVSSKDEGSGDAVTGTCCKRGQTFCMRGSPARAFCCPRGTRCCNYGAGGGTGGLIGGVCCSRLTKFCERGVCRCKPGHNVGCGNDCCHPRLHKCCGTIRKKCVPKDADCGDGLPDT